MKEEPRPQRHTETYEVECWRCKRTIELAINAKPYRCGKCGALLVIEWRQRGRNE